MHRDSFQKLASTVPTSVEQIFIKPVGNTVDQDVTLFRHETLTSHLTPNHFYSNNDTFYSLETDIPCEITTNDNNPTVEPRHISVESDEFIDTCSFTSNSNSFFHTGQESYESFLNFTDFGGQLIGSTESFGYFDNFYCSFPEKHSNLSSNPSENSSPSFPISPFFDSVCSSPDQRSTTSSLENIPPVGFQEKPTDFLNVNGSFALMQSIPTELQDQRSPIFQQLPSEYKDEKDLELSMVGIELESFCEKSVLQNFIHSSSSVLKNRQQILDEIRRAALEFQLKKIGNNLPQELVEQTRAKDKRQKLLNQGNHCPKDPTTIDDDDDNDDDDDDSETDRGAVLSNQLFGKRLRNKKAASRYRCKRKEQRLSLSTQRVMLEERNAQLKKQVEEAEKELKFVRNFFDELRQAICSTTL